MKNIFICIIGGCILNSCIITKGQDGKPGKPGNSVTSTPTKHSEVDTQ